MSERSTGAETRTTSDLVVERLLEWGVDTCFGICGDQVNGFFEALRTHPRMRFVHVRHEENAALACVGYAKFTGRPAACAATAGPGAVHLLNGLYDARVDGAPVIAVTGLSYHDTIGAHFLQDLPSDRLLEHACMFSERIMGPEHALPATDLAVRSALMNRGPAHLAIPIDVQSVALGDDTASPKNVPGHLSLAPQPFTVVPPEDQVRAAAEVLNACDRVAICAGAGARGAGDQLERVAEVLGAPIVKAGLGKDCVPDDSPYTTGGMGLIGTRASHEAFETCDGFLIVGSSTPYYEFWPEPGQARGVQIDLNADRIAMRYPVEVGLVGHAKDVLERLLPLLDRKTDRSFLERAQASYRRWWELIGEQAASSGTPLRPQVVTWELSKALPDGAIVTGDAGTVTAWGGRLRLRRGMRYSFSGTLCSMGSAVPYAIGAQCAHPDRPVIAFTGDGSMSMGMGELATLAQYGLPIKVVVLRNDSLALEVWEQTALLGNPQTACELHPVDFAAVARACGLRAFRIDEPGQAAEVFAEAMAADGPCLIEAVTDPYEAPFGESLQPAHAKHIAEAFGKGEPAAPEMARNLLQDNRVAQSPALQQHYDELARYTRNP
ncbi:thiamine pyrophosphate-dependent enzyme [Actinomadura verrucosospora]|uniref:Thiamine pyrophosphate protein domain-containing protein TPP-binding protein n=1 Tax=Actinomadura verrucosospora TaxID=46165 RepID=A0A7D3VZ69_ACTVE|nr:thiamine pyrophosphate-dependent enzyme [Actinomadura verrucosospora]QKG27080.1 thiamine pyrophosphate protein domain-containing protein TPP-binding protein [Actinomadura verrucosospora]